MSLRRLRLVLGLELRSTWRRPVLWILILMLGFSGCGLSSSTSNPSEGRKALQTADEYVWIYSESPHWWSKNSTATKLPTAYDEAVRRAIAAARK